MATHLQITKSHWIQHLNGWILGYMNYILIGLLKKEGMHVFYYVPQCFWPLTKKNVLQVAAAPPARAPESDTWSSSGLATMASSTANGMWVKLTISLSTTNFRHTRTIYWPWLVWLSGLSAGLRTKGPLVWFPVRAGAWVACRPGPL